MNIALGIEMTAKELERWRSGESQVKPYKVNSIDYQAIIEGLLYVAGEDGLYIEQMIGAVGIDEILVRNLLKKIKNKYDASDMGVELVMYASSYKFVSKDFIFPYAQKLLQYSKPQTLSPSALETLAIIAYKQPITRVEIEELRGVGCEMMLKRLLNRQLIKEAGRSEAPGKPILYEVTNEFMDSFKLEDLKELPDLPKYENEKELFKDYE